MKLNKLHDKLLEYGFKHTLLNDANCYEIKVKHIFNDKDYHIYDIDELHQLPRYVNSESIFSLEVKYKNPLNTIEFGMVGIKDNNMDAIGIMVTTTTASFNTTDKEFDNLKGILKIARDLVKADYEIKGY